MVAKVPIDVEARIVASIGGGGGHGPPLLWDTVWKKRSKYSNRTVRNGYSNRAVIASREAV